MYRLSIFMYLGLFLISCNDRPRLTGSTKDDEDIINEVSKSRAKAFNEQDAAAIAIHFTDSGLLMAPGKPALRGKEAVQSYYQSIFDMYDPVLESRYEEISVSGNLAYGRGFAKVTIVPKAGGDSMVTTSKYINIMQKQEDGTWKTTHDIWNDNESNAAK